jgi:ribA/ribD-fused uncharacterized protein
MPDLIDRFIGKYGFLSNFWSCKIRFEGKTYPSTEHAFQAAKTLDNSERETIRKITTPKEAKRYGRRVKLRKDWESIKLNIAEMVVEQKFKDPELREWLLETGYAQLVEGNFHGDTFWGRCNDVGENHLGRILMKVREKIQGESEDSNGVR